jgi:hypothetical protein
MAEVIRNIFWKMTEILRINSEQTACIERHIGRKAKFLTIQLILQRMRRRIDDDKQRRMCSLVFGLGR